jgi:hypothetical protein
VIAGRYFLVLLCLPLTNEASLAVRAKVDKLTEEHLFSVSAEAKMEVMAAADNSPLLLAYIVVPLIVLAAGPAPCLYAQAVHISYSTTSIAASPLTPGWQWVCGVAGFCTGR